jgi:hypothetical protein
MYLFGIIFIVTSFFILFFKKEKANKIEENNKNELITATAGLSMLETYKILYNICKIKSMKMLALILLTVKVSYFFINYILKHKYLYYCLKN